MGSCISYSPVYSTISADIPAWDGGAYSTVSLEQNGAYQVRVSTAAVGIVVGLTANPAGEGYFNITHGLYFTNGSVYVVESGEVKANLGGFSSRQSFYIRRVNGTVTYARDSVDSVLYTSTVPSTGTVVLDSSFYYPGDELSFAAFVEESGDAEGTAPLILSALGYGEGVEFFTECSAGLVLGASGIGSSYAGGTAGAELGAVGWAVNGGKGSAPFTLGAGGYSGFVPSVAKCFAGLRIGAAGSAWDSVVGTGTAGLVVGARGTEVAEWAEGDAPLRMGVMGVGWQAVPLNRIHFNFKMITDESRSPWPLVNVFPNCRLDAGRLVIPLADIEGLTTAQADPSTGDWTQITKAMLRTVLSHYESMDEFSKPVTAAPWILEGLSTSAVSTEDMVAREENKTTFRFEFIIDYDTETVVNE